MSRTSRRLVLSRESRVILLLAVGTGFASGSAVHAEAPSGPSADPPGKIVAPAVPVAQDIGDCPATAANFEQATTYMCSCPSDQAVGVIYGENLYSDDSNICVAAIHAGVLRNGAAERVTLEIVNSPPVFKGTSRNGVKSEVWPRSTGAAFQFNPGS